MCLSRFAVCGLPLAMMPAGTGFNIRLWPGSVNLFHFQTDYAKGDHNYFLLTVSACFIILFYQ